MWDCDISLPRSHKFIICLSCVICLCVFLLIKEATRLALVSGDQATYARSIRIMGDIYRKKSEINVSIAVQVGGRALPHFHLQMFAYHKTTVLDKLTEHAGLIPWPLNSPDLTHLYFSIREFVKGLVCIPLKPAALCDQQQYSIHHNFTLTWHHCHLPLKLNRDD